MRNPGSLSLVLLVFCCLSSVTGGAPAAAQDMRVYTSVVDLSRGPGEQRELSHSLTLFHGGRVYDYMDDVGEVVIFEPMHHRFIILGKDYTATEVPFAVLNHFLESGRSETTQYIQELADRADGKSARLAASLRFQLDPEFHESFEDGPRRLTLQGGHLSYSVKGAAVESAHLVKQYLRYADWTARLNYVLHPHSAYPESRLKLNENLRERGLLPTQVELTMQLNEPVRLRADHKFDWKLQSVDRQHISHWERMLQSDKLRWMTFHEYQQHLIAQQGSGGTNATGDSARQRR